MSAIIPLLTITLRLVLYIIKRLERDALRNDVLSELAAEVTRIVNHVDVIKERISTADDEYVDKLHRAIERHRAGLDQLDLFKTTPNTDPYGNKYNKRS